MNYRINIGKYSYLINIEKIPNSLLKITFKYNKAVIDEIKQLEGAKWDPELKAWFALDNERNWYNIIALSINNYNPLYDTPLTINKYKDTRQHQDEIASHLLQRKRAIIAGDPGIGKTLAALRAMETVGGKWWIVCPKTTRYVWENEIKKWNANLQYNIIPYHMLSNTMIRFEHQLPQNVVFDESHWLKNWSAQRTQAANTLCCIIRANGGYIYLLSGTPSPNDPTDWWAQTELCQPGFLRESNKNKLMKRLGVVETAVGRGGQQFYKLVSWNDAEVKLMFTRLKGLVLVKRKKDCLDLPDKIYQEITLPCDADTIKAVNFLLETETSALSAHNTLRQFSDGFNYKQNITIPTPKDDALRDICSEIISTNCPRVVIFAAFTASIDKIKSIMKEEGWETITIDGRGLVSDLSNPLETFQDKNIKRPIAFIGQPKAGGISITLTASETIIFYSNDYDAAARMQSEDRIHRFGTTGARIIDLLWLPTDKLCLTKLKLKEDLQSITLGELKRCLSDVETINNIRV